MATETFTLEEAYPAATQPQGFPELVPAKRTRRTDALLMGEDEEATPTGDLASNDHIGTFKTLAAEFGATITSTVRTPERNRRVGGVSNSQHVKGTAGDFVVPDDQADAFMAQARKLGYQVVDERKRTKGTGPHIHLELPPGAKMAANIIAQADEAEDGGGGMADTDVGMQAKATSFSLEDAYGAAVQVPQNAPKPEDGEWYDPAINAAKRSFSHLQNRLLTDLGQIPVDDPRYSPTKGAPDPFAERRRIQAAKDAPAPGPDLKGFIANLENPLKLLTEDSLPANFLEAAAGANDNNRHAFMEARKVTQQEQIVANPDKYPAVSVAAAQRAIDARTAKQDPGIKGMWDSLKQAATEDPGKFGAQLVNALMADPEMLLVPVGLGAKPIQTGRALATGATTTSRTIQLADKILDAGALGASLNTVIEGVDQLASGTHLSAEELQFAAVSGAVIGGPLGAIFSRGARAKILDPEAAKLKGVYDDLLKDQAKYDLEIESVARGEIDPRIPTAAQTRINEMLGITSKTDREKWIQQRRKEIKETFTNDSDYADYLSYLAEERMQRRAVNAERYAADAAARRSSQVEAAFAEREAARLRSFSEGYDNALRAADEAEIGKLQEIAQTENINFDALRKIDYEDALELAFDKDVPAVRNALNRASRRDAGIRQPKWQRGEADPATLARIGLAGGGAAAGFMLFPDEQKMQGGFLGALAGLTIPGGGRVLRRMKQSGAVSDDGNILGLVLKQDKLANEADVIAKAKTGDQKAFEALYNQYFPRLERAARSFVRDAGPKLGIDPSDIAQDTFLKVFQNLDTFKGDSEFYTWLHSIMRNEGLMTIRKASSRIDTTSMHPATSSAEPGSARAGHIVEGEEAGLVRGDVEAAAASGDSPEAINSATETLQRAIESLPPKMREAIRLKELEGFEVPEVAKMMGVKPDAVYQMLKRGKDQIEAFIVKSDLVEKPKGPKGQRGEIDPRLLKAGGVAALGAGAGAFLADENKKLGATIGALGALALMSGGRGNQSMARNLVDSTDRILGPISTRIMNISKPLWRRAIEHERVVLRDVHKHMKAVDPFLVQLNKLPPDSRDIVTRAILTGDPGVTTKLLDAIGNPELIANWKAVRATLDSLGDQLVHLKRFKNKELDYFPRVVKDYQGLLQALEVTKGKEATNFLDALVRDADAKAVRERGTGLTELERSLIVNKALMTEPKLGGQPGFAKDRTVREITPELQKFYATPTESLHSYIRGAVEDIERAKFFGKDLKVVEKGGVEYTNTDQSIGQLVEGMLREGQLTQKQAEELSGMLKSRFMNGERPPSEIIQASKNLSYAGLLGNPLSAATQFGDAIIQTYTQDIRSALSAAVRSLTGRKHVTMENFGLADHLAEEFVSTSRTAKFLNKVFKSSLFTSVDKFGKNVALNAAVIRAARLAKTEGGIAKLTAKHGEYLQPDEMRQFIKDLQEGKMTDLVNSVAFAELSRTQPITRLELPQAYLDNPNGRLLYQFKTFMLKQIDVVRRDAYNEIKKGNVAKGIRNLAEFGIVLGVAGTTTDAIKSFIKGEDIDLKASDIPLNMLKTYGLSEYFMNQAFGVSKEDAAARREAGEVGVRAQKAEPAQAVLGVITPPVKMFDEIVRADPKALRYIPLIGPFLYNSYKAQQEEEND